VDDQAVCHAVLPDKANMAAAADFLSQASEASQNEQPVMVHKRVEDAFEASVAGDLVVLAPGEYAVEHLGEMEDGGIILCPSQAGSATLIVQFRDRPNMENNPLFQCTNVKVIFCD